MQEMEPKNIVFESTDITFHSRRFRPTQSFARALQKAQSNGSSEVRAYGIPRVVRDPKTNREYLALEFSKDITERILNGELMMKSDMPIIIDEETQSKMIEKEKRRLKNSTRVWRKNS